ncbi:MAG TPA: PQQ-binding-like beta-propeller repeat protein [Candidatus Limnocylindria bacterium]|jgi:outer membrane protein assembly factor BamB|nr:PQQ-binding-like beta-propeller repeat protein [Candidatus Limnocylindria bacterium]
MKQIASLLAALACGSAVFAAGGDNWPQWRGPNFNGSTKATGLPAALTKDSAQWTAPLPGKSGATPIVWGDRIFVSSADAQKQLDLLCFDRVSGRQLWSQTVAVGDKEVGRNNMAAPSPVTDGKRVIALYGTGDLAAFDFSGKELWRRNLGKDYGSFGIMWLYGSSPLLSDGRLIIPVLQRDELPPDYPLFDGKPQRESFLLALDPASGKTLWKHVRETDSTKESHESYATPVPYAGKNGNELIVVGGDHVSAHDPKDGTELWRARLYEKRDDWYRIVTSPVTFDGLIYASGPKGQPVVAFKDGGKGNVTDTNVAWKFSENPTDWSTPLVYDGKLFVLDGNKRVLSRLDPKTGEKKWSGKLAGSGPIWGSPTGADGKIYVVSEDGVASVADAGDEFKLLGTCAFEGEGPCKSSVAVAHGQILIRTAKNLYAFGGGKSQ